MNICDPGAPLVINCQVLIEFFDVNGGIIDEQLIKLVMCLIIEIKRASHTTAVLYLVHTCLHLSCTDQR
jgi:hypothetical protein